MPEKARGSRLLLAAGVVIVALLAGAYLLLPVALERLVAAQVRSGFDLEGGPEVDLHAQWPPSPPGSFSGGRIVMPGAKFEGVQTETTVIDLEPFELDLASSLANLAPRSEEPPSGALRAELGEGEVARLVRQATDVPVRGVQLEDGAVAVRSEAEALGVEVPLSVWGNLTLNKGALVFEPEDITAAGLAVPDELAEGLLEGARFEYVPEKLPYGATLTGAEAREGTLVLTGEVDSIPLG